MSNAGKVEAKELRKGNALRYGKSKALRPEFHGRMMIAKIKDIEHIDSYPNSGIYERLPITRELLGIFGFAKTKTDDDPILFRKGKVWLKPVPQIKGYALYYSDTNDDWFYTTTICVHYAHELQNLFYSLTGAELEVK